MTRHHGPAATLARTAVAAVAAVAGLALVSGPDLVEQLLVASPRGG